MQDDAAMVTTVRAHHRIAQAIRDRDADEAREAMKAVIAQGFGRAAERMPAD
jgi:DNA-binding GntR family transcriptional regulator